MAEQIKEFYNDVLVEEDDLISNAANTKALLKRVSLCNTTFASISFDIKSDTTNIYKNIEIAADETVIFDNENIVVPESKSLSVVLNTIPFQDILSKIETTDAILYTQVYLTEDDNIIFLGCISTSLYYGVYTAKGVVIREFGVASTAVIGFNNTLSITETDTHFHLIYDGATYPTTCTITKSDWTNTGGTTIISHASVVRMRACRFGGTGSNYVIGMYYYPAATSIYFDITSGSTKLVSAALLCNAENKQFYPFTMSENVGWAYVYSGAGKVNSINTSGTKGTPVDFDSSVYTILGADTLSDGKVAIAFIETSTYDCYLIILNSNFTVSVSKILVSDTSYYDTGNISSRLKVTPNDEILILHQHDTTPYEYKVSMYESDGTLIKANITFALVDDGPTADGGNLSSSYSDIEINSKGQLLLSYRDNASPYYGHLNCYTIEVSLHVNASGVEVTA